MRYVGIDIGAERHVVAIVGEDGAVLTAATPFQEDAEGYRQLRAVMGDPTDTVVAMEATGHYWQNLFAYLVAEGFAVALLNPLRTHRFAAEDLARTKTDRIDAVLIARFAAQKRPPATPLTEPVLAELRELVRLRDRLVQEAGDRVRQLHRLVDLGFPEFTRHIPNLNTRLATSVLAPYPNAAAFRQVSRTRLAKLRYDGRHSIGPELAQVLLESARQSVGQYQAPAYHVQVRYACEDLELLRQRIHELERDIECRLRDHEIGTLLTTIDGVGPQTAARLIAELGNPGHFRSAAALAAYVGLVPGLKQSGKHRPVHAALVPIGHARLRAALWMPTLVATRFNPWLRAYYERLRARGKHAKVALIAVMRKLLTAVFSVAKSKRPFVPHTKPLEVPA